MLPALIQIIQDSKAKSAIPLFMAISKIRFKRFFTDCAISISIISGKRLMFFEITKNNAGSQGQL